MLWTQEVVHRLYWVEGFDWHFHKHGNPVAHRAVPQSWQLKCLDVNAIFRLHANQASVKVNKFLQIEFLALIVFQIAHQIPRIEVCAAVH